LIDAIQMITISLSLSVSLLTASESKDYLWLHGTIECEWIY
jgi:hypothetical protein